MDQETTILENIKGDFFSSELYKQITTLKLGNYFKKNPEIAPQKAFTSTCPSKHQNGIYPWKDVFTLIKNISLAWNQVKSEINILFIKEEFSHPKLGERNISNENDINK